MKYIVKTSEFEGPLDLLMSLIEKRKLLINDVSLSRVTEDYISHIQEMQGGGEYEGGDDIDTISDFIVIAATLILIKSKSLLPTLDLSYEEEASIDELERRLEKFKLLRERSTHIESLFGRSPLFSRDERQRSYEIRFTPDPSITINALFSAMKELTYRLPKEEKRPRVEVKRTIRLDDVIEGLRERIERGLSLSFDDLVGRDRKERVSVIVHFLALLELVKEGSLDAYQEDDGTIEIVTKTISTPSY